MKKRYLTLLFFLSFDVVFSEISFFAATSLSKNPLYTEFPFIVWPLIVIFAFYILKIYNILWEFSTFVETLHILPATALAIGILFVTQAAFSMRMEYKCYAVLFVLMAVFTIITRLLYKQIVANFSFANTKKENVKPLLTGNVMVIGAGSAGGVLINEFALKKEYSKCKIKCVIDDNPYLKGNYISGIKIIGGREYIISAAKRYNIDTIIFAIPNCSKDEKTKILSICQRTGCSVKLIPPICKLYSENEFSNNLSAAIKDVEIEDLLGREVLDINSNTSLDYVENKVVLVTGGGGTIGSELCRQIAEHNPKTLIIFDIYENNAYEIQNELKFSFPALALVTLIGSVRDSKRMDYVFRTYKPQIVFHAAAHKHVPLMEDSPNESIKNNVFGTLKTARCADRYGAEKMVLISTDKAVNPTNIMGASKRICEMIVQSYNKKSKTEFVAVRFGNVLGSNGSVIPLFKEQIKHGGPVTVTDPNIIRYFMTIPEAVSLVLQAGANAKGGEIFVLDMGKPVKILDLAENLIRLSGFTPYEDIDIIFTGLRPGEKLYEELLMGEEGLTDTENKLIHIGKPIEIDEEFLFKTLDQMLEVMYDENVDVRSLVKSIVPTYIIGKDAD